MVGRSRLVERPPVPGMRCLALFAERPYKTWWNRALLIARARAVRPVP
ncbi:MAG: hypothetical protein M3406_09385 [Chloroflexota bacterium]|nr:hypothetical protein [Chloroflexota bacterium]